MSNVVVYVLLAIFFSLSANSAELCGRVTRGSEWAQLIPSTGKPLSKISSNQQVPCGAMLITHEEPVWIELADLTQFKIAPATFFEFSKKNEQQFHLYRGKVMAYAPPTIRTLELSTPNSFTIFHGGVMLLGYSAKEKKTTLACFDRKVEFQNKFYPSGSKVVSAGERSHLWIGNSNIVPSNPEMIDPLSIQPELQSFAMAETQVKELTQSVEEAILARSKSYVADLESWEQIQGEKEKHREAQRNVASYSKKGGISSIDFQEAKTALKWMKKRIYGEEEDWKIHDQTRRDPSSLHSEKKFKDEFYDRKKIEVSKKVKRVSKEIENFEPEEE